MAERVQGFTADRLMTVWEQGSTLDDVGRAVLLLAHGERLAPEAAARLDIGQRDQRLLALRAATFGTRLESFLECGACGEPLEFALDARQFQGAGGDATEEEPEPSGAGWTMRLPDSLDLRAASGCGSPEAAQEMLFQRCVAASDAGPIEVSPANLQRFSGWLQRRSPELELLLEVDCPACGARHSALLEIVSFFWREIESACARLVREVDALARVYGWSEEAILAMTAARRRNYLQAATA